MSVEQEQISAGPSVPAESLVEQPRAVEIGSVGPKVRAKLERQNQMAFIRAIKAENPELFGLLDERTRSILEGFSVVTDEPVRLIDVGIDMGVTRTTVRASLFDGVARIWESAPEETRERFSWENLLHFPIEKAKKIVKERGAREYAIDEVDMSLWQAAQEENLLEKIGLDGLMTPGEIKRIKDYFEGRKKGRNIETLLEKFSKKLALVA